MPLKGIVVPGFVVGEVTDATTSGRIYSAIEEASGREVSLRILDRVEATEAARASFSQEMQVLARLGSHPNVVTLYSVTQCTDGRPVLVTERCGLPLAARLTSIGPFDPELAVSFSIKLAGALEVAHASGLIHRDVNPANVRRSPYEEPLLDGFGLAQFVGDVQASTAFQSVCIAPELLEGLAATPQTDVYGLAATLYCMVAGRPLFPSYSGESPAVVGLRILTEGPLPLTGSPEILAISDALAASLSKDPSDRATTAVEFAGVLRGVQDLFGWGATSESVLPSAEVTSVDPRVEVEERVPDLTVPSAAPVVVPLGSRQCPSGHEVPETAKFCRKCGEPIDLSQVPRPMMLEQRIERPAIGLPRLSAEQPDLDPVEHAEEQPSPSASETIAGDRSLTPRLTIPEPRRPRVVLSPDPITAPAPPVRREVLDLRPPAFPTEKVEEEAGRPVAERFEVEAPSEEKRILRRWSRAGRSKDEKSESDDGPGFGIPSSS